MNDYPSMIAAVNHLEGAVMDATPTLMVGTVTVGPHASASERGSVRGRRTSVLAAL